MLKIFVVLIHLIVLIRLFDIGIINHNYYNNEYTSIVDTTYYSSSAPRGRILDSNGKILVDNKGIKSLVYKKNSNTNLQYLCENLAEILNFSNISVSEKDLMNYYY